MVPKNLLATTHGSDLIHFFQHKSSPSFHDNEASNAMPFTHSPPLFTRHTYRASTTATSINNHDVYSEDNRKTRQKYPDLVNIVKSVKKNNFLMHKTVNIVTKMRTTNCKISIFCSVSSIFTLFLMCVKFITGRCYNCSGTGHLAGQCPSSRRRAKRNRASKDIVVVHHNHYYNGHTSVSFLNNR